MGGGPAESGGPYISYAPPQNPMKAMAQRGPDGKVVPAQERRTTSLKSRP
jgi:hypothetical protein